LIEWAAISIWLAVESGSIALTRVNAVLENFINKAIFKRKLLKSFQKIIDDLMVDESINIDADTIVELNRLKNNIADFNPILEKISELNEFAIETRKNKTIKFLQLQFAEEYTIPPHILNPLIENFIESSYNFFNEFVKSSQDQFQKEVISSLMRIENQNQQSAKNEALFWQKIVPSIELIQFIKGIENRLDVLQNNTSQIQKEVIGLNRKMDEIVGLSSTICNLTQQIENFKKDHSSSWVKTYFHVFAEILKECKDNDEENAILKFNELLNRIKQDREIHQHEQFWNDISRHVMKFECFIYHNLSVFYLASSNNIKSIENGKNGLELAKKLNFKPTYISMVCNSLANSHFAINDTINAEIFYKKAINLDPQCEDAYNNYALLLREREEKTKNQRKILKKQ
jgi:tetratricopeptide (TPR) repeat protein